MKRVFLFCISVFLFLSGAYRVQAVHAEEVNLDLHAPSAVLMDPTSRTVLFEKNAHQKLYPASMTKMMGLYLIIDAIHKGKITWEDEVVVSSYAASMGGTQIFLEENEKMSVWDLTKAVAINSANDAIVALGEYVASSNDRFVAMMNEKAEQFGMDDTHFANATGFDDENHYTSAYDMAIIGSHLVSFGKDILQFTSMPEGYVRENSTSPFWLVNTNKLLKYYEGLDGLKTGYTNKAGYNLTATAMRKGVRLISVVMHLDTIQHRSQDTIRLMDYGFSQLKMERLFDAGTVIAPVEYEHTLTKNIQAIVKEPVDVLLNKEETLEDVQMQLELYQKDPPIDMDEPIGDLIIQTKYGRTYRFQVYADRKIEKVTFFDYFLHHLLSFFF